MEGRQPRKLAVILHADVVGSTALVQRDESLAHERIRDAFQRFSGTIESYNGHSLELRGDALLAEFSRASDAVEASLAFQAENTRFNSTQTTPSQRPGWLNFSSHADGQRKLCSGSREPFVEIRIILTGTASFKAKRFTV